MIRELLDMNKTQYERHSTIYMVPNPAAPKFVCNNTPEMQPANHVARTSQGGSVGQGNSVNSRKNPADKGK
ncbi:hypothetical protein PIB30_074226, partial [Stylosanthes scabra]|nr:hypothetical protein [Stylosanthes scabra]